MLHIRLIKFFAFLIVTIIIGQFVQGGTWWANRNKLTALLTVMIVTIMEKCFLIIIGLYYKKTCPIYLNILRFVFCYLNIISYIVLYFIGIKYKFRIISLICWCYSVVMCHGQYIF